MNTTDSLNPLVFQFCPISSFSVEERRSLTVHIEDAGMFDVSACEGDAPTFAGRYASFDAAQSVADGLNKIWRACPGSTSAEVLAFASKRAAPELLEALCAALPFVEEALELYAADFKPGFCAGRVAMIRAAIAKAEGSA